MRRFRHLVLLSCSDHEKIVTPLCYFPLFDAVWRIETGTESGAPAVLIVNVGQGPE